MKKILLNTEFYDADDLATTLDEMSSHAPRGSVIDIKGPNGENFFKAALEEETLTDGSKAYNIILSE